QLVEQEVSLEEPLQVVAGALALLFVHTRVPGPRLNDFLATTRSQLFLAEALLPVALAGTQLERRVSRAGLEATVMGVAAVAHDGVADAQVEQPVQQRRAEQDGPRQPLLVPAV